MAQCVIEVKLGKGYSVLYGPFPQRKIAREFISKNVQNIPVDAEISTHVLYSPSAMFATEGEFKRLATEKGSS